MHRSRGNSATSKTKTKVTSAPSADRGAGCQRWTLAIVGAAALIAVVASSDRGRSPHDALDACVDLSRALQRCFPDRKDIHPPPAPSTQEARIAASKRCEADKTRIERACR